MGWPNPRQTALKHCWSACWVLSFTRFICIHYQRDTEGHTYTGIKLFTFCPSYFHGTALEILPCCPSFHHITTAEPVTSPKGQVSRRGFCIPTTGAEMAWGSCVAFRRPMGTQSANGNWGLGVAVPQSRLTCGEGGSTPCAFLGRSLRWAVLLPCLETVWINIHTCITRSVSNVKGDKVVQ